MLYPIEWKICIINNIISAIVFPKATLILNKHRLPFNLKYNISNGSNSQKFTQNFQIVGIHKGRSIKMHIFNESLV